MLAGGRLSPILKQILVNPRILKVGRAVGADLKYLQEACQSPDPSVGAVDLAQLAKERLIISSAKISLVDLCAKVLGKRLKNNVTVRVSSAWEQEQLTDAQIRYAALDVYACQEIYAVLSQIPLPTPLPNPPTLGMSILLFSPDRTRLIARGTIKSLEGTYANRVNITKTKCVIEVTEVVVPGTIIKIGNQQQSLGDFGSVPFNLLSAQSSMLVACIQYFHTSAHATSSTPKTNSCSNRCSTA
jgi:hypothetical protein